MKRLIYNSFDPETNPTDAARSVIDTLNSDITSIRNVVKGYANIVKNHPDDDSKMNKIVDELSYLQAHLDDIISHYLDRQ